ncbi:MAG: pepsin-like aspartyl protease [Myxococcota bacterium]
MKMTWCLIVGVALAAPACGDDPDDPACELQHFDLDHQASDESGADALGEAVRPRHGVYMATLALGTPAQEVNAIIDTGSANLVVMGPGCDGCDAVDYNPETSTTASEPGAAFTVMYGSAALSATTNSDMVGLPCGDSVEASFGVATEVAHLPSSILGLAYQSLAEPSGAPLTPWLDAMVDGGVLADIFSLRLCGAGRSGSHLKLGGMDESVDASALAYTPIVEERYYAISPPSFSMGETALGEGAATSIVDSGTTLMLVPQSVHQALVSVLKAAAEAQGVSAQIPDGVWTESASDISARATLTEAEVAALPPLTMTLKGEATGDTFQLQVPPERYFRRASSGDVYLGVRPGPGMTILGQVFMEGLDVVFDRAQSRIGFATSSCED